MLVTTVEQFKKERAISSAEGGELLAAFEKENATPVYGIFKWKLVPVPNSGCQEEYDAILQHIETELKVEFEVMDFGVGYAFRLSTINIR